MVTRPIAPPFPIVAWFERRSKAQRRLGGVLVAMVALALALRQFAAIVLDRWWFASVTTAPVWSTQVTAQVTIAVLAMILAGALLIPTARSAFRTPPAAGNSPNRIVVRYRERMASAHGWLLAVIAGLVTAWSGLGAMTRWKQWLLFWHAPDLGSTTPYLGWDLGYHLFRLPFVLLVSSWVRQLLLVAFAIAAIGYIANGALKIPRDGRRSSPRALKHLSLIGALYALAQAADYIFVRWPALGTNQRGSFDGPGFTEIKVVVPSLVILAGAALAVGYLFTRAVQTQKWRPAIVGSVALGVLHLTLLSAIPAAVTRLVVTPTEGERQLPYIAENLSATIDAYGLGAVEQVSERLGDGLDGPVPADFEADFSRIPVLAETQMAAPLQVLQGTTATRIRDVDLDRYVIDGVRRPVLIAARNSNRADLPEKGWVQSHLVYTHGDGVVAVPADSVAPDGRPDVAAYAGLLATDRPELYFGEGMAGWYAIVGTRRTEVGGGSFAGHTGISLSSRWRRLVLGLSVGEIEPVVSSELTGDSQLLFRRDILERLTALAPFLSYDSDPFPTVTDDGIVWIVDAYTTARTYPYAQFARDAGLPASSGMAGSSFNYMHASVKATVNAYDGSVHLYRTEVGGADDPILHTWSSIFPGLIEPIAAMPDQLREHLVYPDDLLTVQTSMLGRYHVSDAETLFSGSDSWAISASVGESVVRAGAESVGAVPAPAVSLFMPSSEPLGGHWVAIRPYGVGSASNPTSVRAELAAYAVADHDDPERLLLVRVEVVPGEPVSDPRVAQAAIDTDSDFAALFTLLNANGSSIQFGPMTPVPISGAVVWVRSIVVTGTADTTTPRLHSVAVVSDGVVGEAGSAFEALLAAVSK